MIQKHIIYKLRSGIKPRNVAHELFKTMTLCILIFTSLDSAAREFTYDGILYKVLDEDLRTCSTAYQCYASSSVLIADGNIIIPEEVYDENEVCYRVTKIGSYSFNGAGRNLKSITLPNTIKEIGFCAFFGCSSLESLRLPEELTCIGDQAFMHCSGLKSIDFPYGLERIYDGAFQYCKSIESLEIPDSVNYLGSEAFSDCTSLKSVKLPGGAPTITHGLFAGCTALEFVEFSEGIELICGWWYPYSMMSDDYPIPGAFYKCTGLKHLKFADSLEEIDCGAFDGCKGVETIVLPQNLMKLEARAFDCPSLREVIYPVSDPRELPRNYYDDGSPIEVDRFGFPDYIYDIAVLKVGVGGLGKARITSPWKFFTNIEEVDFSGVDEISSVCDVGCSGVYRMDGMKVGDTTEGLPSGLYIVKLHGKNTKVLIP